MKISVIIPSLNPDDKLVSVVDSLVKKGFEDIIIVNDGSDSAHLWPFEKVGSYSQCTILTHEVNKGKGRGLKTAFEYCLKNRQGYDGVVTVDGDNQHRADDIYNCCEAISFFLLYEETKWDIQQSMRKLRRALRRKSPNLSGISHLSAPLMRLSHL